MGGLSARGPISTRPMLLRRGVICWLPGMALNGEKPEEMAGSGESKTTLRHAARRSIGTAGESLANPHSAIVRRRPARALAPRVEILATRHTQAAPAMAVAVLLSACATTPAMQPFSTDGCSLFPDRSLVGKSDWCSCCLVHDLAYWRGGTADERLEADEDLKSCVLAASGSAELAEFMFVGVRTGGGPYFFTPYRWGYGRSPGRPYEPLSTAEEAQASSLRAEYISTNPGLVCPDASR